ncbi:AAA family ATPase [Ottowia testudinis]|uniref:AAA family ATPase n=1 Tax=Ottowia testudinis TaxID=2816950 RepID=A0A975H3R5_9BURK|nr:AAA family ATPase [Ottowia testudinis]QTD46158.1 AAA family ATPase [Ottowia testudinis]
MPWKATGQSTQGDSMAEAQGFGTESALLALPTDGSMRQTVARAMHAGGVSQADLARQTGLSQSALSQWLNGSYKGDNAAIQAKLTAWLTAHGTRQVAVEETPAPQWVDTPTGRAVAKALTFARNKPAIAVVYGGAGVGKTTALRRFARHTQNVWIATASPAISSMAAMLRELCRVLELSGTGWKNQALSADIVRHLAGSRGLLIIDEAQHLSVPALEQLRYIYDQAETGLVLSGNERVFSQLNGGHVRSADFAQLYSRLGRRLRLSLPSEGDIDAVLNAWDITGRAERAYAAQIACLPGGLRGLFNLLEEARLAAKGMGQPVDVRLMRMAWADLVGAQ